jgi:hypothetical protein
MLRCTPGHRHMTSILIRQPVRGEVGPAVDLIASNSSRRFDEGNEACGPARVGGPCSSQAREPLRRRIVRATEDPAAPLRQYRGHADPLFRSAYAGIMAWLRSRIRRRLTSTALSQLFSSISMILSGWVTPVLLIRMSIRPNASSALPRRSCKRPRFEPGQDRGWPHVCLERRIDVP